MEKRIELERRGKHPNQVTELNLDNTRATHMEGLTDDYTSLGSLSLVKVGLTSLKGFPKLPKLRRLELSDNRISNGLIVLEGCPKLSHLNLSNNKIKDLDTLEPLKSFDSLTHLDLFNNELCNLDSYRSKVFKMLPNLKYLDDVDADENERDDSEDGDCNGEAESEEEEEEDDDEEEGPGLAAIYNDNLEDDEDGDYDEEDAGDEEEDDLDEEEEAEEPTGKRRKVQDGGDTGD